MDNSYARSLKEMEKDLEAYDLAKKLKKKGKKGKERRNWENENQIWQGKRR